MTPCRQEPDHDRGAQAQDQRKQQRADIDRGVVEARHFDRSEGHDRTEAHVRETDTQDACDERQHDRFAEQLPNDLQPPRSEGESHGHFARPCRAVNQQQRCRVGARNQQQRARGAGNREQRRTSGTEQVRHQRGRHHRHRRVRHPVLQLFVAGDGRELGDGVFDGCSGRQAAERVHRPHVISSRQLPTKRRPDLRAGRNPEVLWHHADHFEGHCLLARADGQQPPDDGGIGRELLPPDGLAQHQRGAGALTVVRSLESSSD